MKLRAALSLAIAISLILFSACQNAETKKEETSDGFLNGHKMIIASVKAEKDANNCANKDSTNQQVCLELDEELIRLLQQVEEINSLINPVLGDDLDLPDPCDTCPSLLKKIVFQVNKDISYSIHLTDDTGKNIAKADRKYKDILLKDGTTLYATGFTFLDPDFQGKGTIATRQFLNDKLVREFFLPINIVAGQ